MTDLISRQAAIKAIEDLQDCYNGFSDTYDKACIIGVIEEVPSIEPRKHGRWLIYNILDYAKRPTGRKVGKCSICGQLTPDFRLITEEPNWSYCPNCGAKMDKEDEE